VVWNNVLILQKLIKGMDLKDNYRNLPTFITKVIQYSTIQKYVFFDGTLPVELQNMIDSKTPGYSRVFDLLRAKELAQRYGCVNEKELIEAGEIEMAFRTRFFGRNSDHGDECWQNEDLN